MIPGLWDMHVHARGTPALLSGNGAWLTLYIANGITGVVENWNRIRVVSRR